MAPTSDANDRTFTLTLPSEVLLKLKALAAADDRSSASVVRRLIERAFDEHPQQERLRVALRQVRKEDSKR